MKKEAKRWMEFAGEDLKMAELALNEGIYNQTCFHSQQCVEKILKGFIISKGELHPQAHKLADILSRIEDSPFDDVRDKMLLLDRFYIPTRYPDALPGSLPEGLPGEKDAEEALEIARKVFNIAEKYIDDL